MPINQLTSIDQADEQDVESPTVTWKSKVKKSDPTQDTQGETIPGPSNEPAARSF